MNLQRNYAKGVNKLHKLLDNHTAAIAIMFTLCLLIAIAISHYVYGETPAYINGKDFSIIEVVDGDTIAIKINTKDSLPQAVFGNRILVRIKGIDTPELSSTNEFVRSKAHEAKSFVQTKINNGKKIYLKNIDRDKYFRLLADLFVDGKSIADELLWKGLAQQYNGGRKPIWE